MIPTILLAIPTYKRRKIILRALQIIALRIIDQLIGTPNPPFKFLVFVYEQRDGNSIEPPDDYGKSLIEAYQENGWLNYKIVYTLHPTIGQVMRCSVEHALDWAENELKQKIDWVFMSDDDIFVKNRSIVDQIQRALCFLENSWYSRHISVVSEVERTPKIGGKNKYKIASLGLPVPENNGLEVYSFPKETKDTPFKARGILIDRSVVSQILHQQIDDITVGEDLYIFLRALGLGLHTLVINGVSSWLHLPHTEGQDTADKLPEDGGFSRLIQSQIADSTQVTDENKYFLAALHTAGSVHRYYTDLFDWKYVSRYSNNVRPDILWYLENHWYVDKAGYLNRNNSIVSSEPAALILRKHIADWVKDAETQNLEDHDFSFRTFSCLELSDILTARQSKNALHLYLPYNFWPLYKKSTHYQANLPRKPFHILTNCSYGLRVLVSEQDVQVSTNSLVIPVDNLNADTLYGYNIGTVVIHQFIALRSFQELLVQLYPALVRGLVLVISLRYSDYVENTLRYLRRLELIPADMIVRYPRQSGLEEVLLVQRKQAADSFHHTKE